LYSEESKGHDKRESFSNPQPKKIPFKGVPHGSIESDLIGGSNRTPDVIIKYNDTFSKSLNTSGPSFKGIEPNSSDNTPPVPIEVNNLQKFIELLMNKNP